MNKENFIVFGASDKVSKLFLCGKEHGMKCVKIFQLKDSAERTLDDNVTAEEIEGIYTTLYFAKKHGKKSLKIFISVLQKLLDAWESEGEDEEEM